MHQPFTRSSLRGLQLLLTLYPRHHRTSSQRARSTKPTTTTITSNYPLLCPKTIQAPSWLSQQRCASTSTNISHQSTRTLPNTPVSLEPVASSAKSGIGKPERVYSTNTIDLGASLPPMTSGSILQRVQCYPPHPSRSSYRGRSWIQHMFYQPSYPGIGTGSQT